MKTIINIMGKSGAGKSAIKKKILEKRPELHEVVTCTTRPMRDYEKDGVDYHFYKDGEMAQKIYNNEMAECVVFNDWVYGTAYKDLSDDAINIGAWNPEGAEILNQDESLRCINFLIDATSKVRIIRALEREEDPNVDEIFRRYKADEKDFSDLEVNYFIAPNNGDRTLDEVADTILFMVDTITLGQGQSKSN